MASANTVSNFVWHRLETSYLCHYAHADDLEQTAHPNAEMREWLVQQKLQLVRKYRGKPSEFVPVATAYAKAAVERMDMWKGVDDGRRTVPAIETFGAAKMRERYFPRPRSPPSLADPCNTKTGSSDQTYRRRPKRA